MARRTSHLAELLSKPISNFWRIMGWIGATTIFFGLSELLGGPTEGDAAESVYSTWAIAHGHLACAYPPPSAFPFPSIADPFALTSPLYPLITGALSAILRIGHRAAFPTSTQLGPNCSNAFVQMFHWSERASSILTTINLSYFVWPLLMIGTISLLRSAGRARQGWEPFTLMVLACSPPILMCTVDFFHPQDLLAMGLVLWGLAYVLRCKWVGAGILMGLAFTAQPFAVLVAAPLMVIAPKSQRLRFIASALSIVTVISAPLVILTSGRALKTSLFGSSRVGLVSRTGFRSTGGTVLWEINLRGLLLLIISRIVPIIAAMMFAWWAARRHGSRILEPVPLISLIAISLSFRLVFEENLFGYYFMAVGVALVLLDTMRGHLRGYVVAWIGLVTLAFNPVHWGLYSNWTPWGKQLFEGLPIAAMVFVFLLIIVDAVHHRIRAYKVVWLVLVALTCEPQFWGPSVGAHVLPNWAWQIMLVPTAIFLAAGPLWTATKEKREPESLAERTVQGT